MVQGKRIGGMVIGAMGDMFNSIARPLTPQQIKALRSRKASFLWEVRGMVFAGNMEYLVHKWPYDKRDLWLLRNLYDRLHRPERVAAVLPPR